MRTRIFSLALGCALTLGVTAAALAQDNAPPPPDQSQPGPGGPRRMDPDRQLEHLTRALSLTTDQQAQIKPLLVDRDQKMQALFQNQSISQQDRHTQMRSISDGTNNSIKAVLTDQQKQKFDEMHEHMGRRGRGEGGPPPAEAPPAPQQ